MKTDPKIDWRDNVTPVEAEHKYGHVNFADPTNKQYPIDTLEYILAA